MFNDYVVEIIIMEKYKSTQKQKRKLELVESLMVKMSRDELKDPLLSKASAVDLVFFHFGD
jgi:hypothetical protein